MGKILIGTASWTDPQLIKAGTFYPPGVNDAESRLRFYSDHFPIVEVDSSYYALPSPFTAQLWVERTPNHFVFDVKSYSLFTNHPTQVKALPKDVAQALGPLPEEKKRIYYKDVPEDLRDELWSRFKAALEPLAQAGKMGLVLLQFPPWFHPSPESKEHILRCVEKLKPLRPSVEFRSAYWVIERHRADTFSFLRTHKLPFVCVDEPQGFKSSLPPLAEVTSDVALVRFHGRNRETWDKKGISASDRFNWHYTPGELKEWVPKIEQMASATREVHLLMNTNHGDQGIVNARLLARLLHEPLGGQTSFL